MVSSPFTRTSDESRMGQRPGMKRARSVRKHSPGLTTPPRLPCSSFVSLSRSESRRRHHFRLASVTADHSGDIPLACSSDLEFSFPGAVLCDESDLELLPDLSDDSSMAGSVCSAVTPTKNNGLFFGDVSLPLTPGKRLFAPRDVAVADLELCPVAATPSIFDMPELVFKIIEFVDAQNTAVPKEKAPLRRRPLSYKHALLMHGDPASAKRAMELEPELFAEPHGSTPGALHSCLLVNRLFHRITKQIMGSRLFFSSENSLYQFVKNDDPEFFSSFRPTSLVLNKLFCAKQAAMDKIINSIDYSRLEWLEIYMCPKISPSERLFHSSLRSLVITGSKTVDDSMLIEVSKRCPNLQVLDLRACEGITDYGVYALSTSCSQLVTINLGRKKQGHLITDHSVSTLVCNNKRLQTVGLAGCYITDRTIWELAINCGHTLERLSLNNCPYITNQSLPVILHHNLLPHLSVLEIRFLLKITNFDPVVVFQRRQSSKGICMLIEMCEELMMRLKECERRMDSHISEVIFQDISDWANTKDEEDLSYQELVRSRV